MSDAARKNGVAFVNVRDDGVNKSVWCWSSWADLGDTSSITTVADFVLYIDTSFYSVKISRECISPTVSLSGDVLMRLHHAMVVTVPLFNKVSNYYAEPRHPKDTVHVSTHNRTFACSLHLGGVDVVVVKPTPMLLLENSVGMAKAFNLGLKTHIGLQIAVSEISNELNEATTALKELTDAAVDESLRLEEREDQILQFAAAVINSRSSPLEQIPEVSLPANPSVVDSWSDTSDEYAEPDLPLHTTSVGADDADIPLTSVATGDADLPLHTTSVGADDADIPLTSVAAGNADQPLHTTSVGAAPPHRDPIDWSSAEDSPPPKTCSAKQRMAALRKSRR